MVLGCSAGKGTALSASGDAGHVSTDAADSSGITDAFGIADGSSSVDVFSVADALSSLDARTEAGLLCTDLTNDGSLLPQTLSAGFVTAYGGGVITDGTYVLTGAGYYPDLGSAEVIRERRIIRLSGNGSQFEYIIEEDTRSSLPSPIPLAGTVSVSATTISLLSTCGSYSPSYNYTVTAAGFAFYYWTAGNQSELTFTFTRKGSGIIDAGAG
jgi:hypothetical protein